MTQLKNKSFFLSFGLLILMILFASARPKHEYHVSVAQMQFNAAQKTLEISIKAYTDDMEKGLSLANENRRFILRNNDGNDAYVEKYLKSHFALADPSRRLQPVQYIGKEQEADVTWFYLEVPFSGNPEGWVLRHDLLTETFDDQVNMVNVKWGGQRKTYLFKKSQPVQAL